MIWVAFKGPLSGVGRFLLRHGRYMRKRSCIRLKGFVYLRKDRYQRCEVHVLQRLSSMCSDKVMCVARGRLQGKGLMQPAYMWADHPLSCHTKRGRHNISNLT